MSVVLVTGAGRRLGKEIAIKFAEKGWDIVIHYNNSVKGAVDTMNKINKLGQKSTSIQADLTKPNEIKRLFEQLVQQDSIPNVLVNNSGIFPKKQKISDIDIEIWDEVQNINLKAAFLMSKEFSNIAKPLSKIINIASLGGIEIWNKRIPYNVSKAALLHLTKALARELAPDISVNSVSPGSILIEYDTSPVDTSLIDVKKVPMARLGNPQDVFEAVYFFATSTQYITGQNITVDGGYHLAH